MTRRPRIGITTDTGHTADRYQLVMSYASAVEEAGGLPLPIPYRTAHELIGEILDTVDGVLFSGGDDMDPARFGEERHPQAIPLDLTREQFELALLAEVERRRTPALCICLGCQVLNLHRGGSLMQFLPEVPRDNAIEHRKIGQDLPRHVVNIEPQSLLGRAIGKTQVLANSYHKQAIRELGRGLNVVARAPDGIIEAVEDPTMPLLLAVQWHPERLYDEPDHLALFKLLVETAQAHLPWSAGVPTRSMDRQAGEDTRAPTEQKPYNPPLCPRESD